MSPPTNNWESCTSNNFKCRRASKEGEGGGVRKCGRSGEVCEMAEMLASAAVKAAWNKLGAILAEEAGLVWNLREDLVFIKTTLATIQAVLKDAERQSMEHNASVTLWLQRLKSAAYDIEDMLEDFTATNPREELGDGVEDNNNCFGKVSLFCSSLHSSHRNIAHEIKKMKKRLEEIQAQQSLAGNFAMDSHLHELDVITERETISDVKESIVGRDEEKDIIIRSLLTENGEDIAFIAIHGIGGMGKTTLARLAFNDETVVKFFDQRIWVYVSMKYDLKQIGESILSQVDDEYRSYRDLQSLKLCLKTVLHDKTVLIVLDDLWEEGDQKLETLKGFLNFGTKKCKVILTTRKEQIATKMKPVLAHKLEVLSGEDCWLLFKQTVGEHADSMQQIGEDIVNKCKGVPLAIKSVGFIMQSKRRVAEWEATRDSNIWKMEEGAPSSTKGVLPSLRLSFHHLPAHLKLCFAYCSIFPKGFEIDKDLLIQQWIAMGFMESKSTAGASSSMTQEELGQKYVEILVGMSFLQASGTPLSVANKLAITPRRFHMHDLIRDLATLAAGEEVLFSDFEKKSKVNARYAVFLNCSQASTLLKSVPSKARALHFRNCKQLQLPKKASPLSRFLRVLDLSGCSIVELPRYITHQMKLLKFLDASGLQNPMPPEHLSRLCSLHALNLSHSTFGALPSHIGDLCKLHYLNLHNCSHLSELPESFVHLKDLLHLDLSKCISLHALPTSFGNLHKLTFLDLSGCTKLKMLPDSLQYLVYLETLNLSSCRALQELPSHFGNLRKLHKLDLSDCQHLHKLPESLCEILQLEYLSLSCCCRLVELPECFGELRRLYTLNLSDCHELLVLPESFMLLKNLEELIMSGCWELKKLPASFGDLCKLRILDMSCCIQLSILPESFLKLVNLEYLDLSCCTALERIPGYCGNLKKLEVLNISYCFGMKIPEGIKGIAGICGLKNLLAIGIGDHILNGEDGGFFDSFTCYKSIISFRKEDRSSGIEDMKTTSLTVTGLSMVHNTEEVVALELQKRQHLRRLKLDFRYYDSRRSFCYCDRPVDHGLPENFEVLKALLPPRTLEQFELEGYESMELPFWMMNVMSYLPNIVHLRLHNLGRCDTLPPLGQLPKLLGLEILNMPNLRKVGTEFSGGHKSFLKLRALRIENLKNLEEWCISTSVDGGGVLVFRNLHKVEIIECPKLKFVPFLPPCLSLRIHRNDSVLSSGWPNAPLYSRSTMTHISQEDARLTNSVIQKLDSNNLVELSLRSLKMIDCLPPLGQLPMLRVLRIREIPKIKKVGNAGGSTPFPRLRILQIRMMPNLEEWHTIQSTNNVEEHIFPVLEELDVCWCHKLRFVPFFPRCTSNCSIVDCPEVFLSGQHNGPPSYHMPTSELYYRGPSAGFTGLEYFTALKSLKIACTILETMSSLGEIIKCLTSLESLWMSYCTVSLESLGMSGCMVGGGEWLGALTSLRSLRICRCSLPLHFAQYVLHLTTLETLELEDVWRAIKVLSEGEVQALIRQIPNVTISKCGPVEEANWKNGMLTDWSFYEMAEFQWRSKNYYEEDAGGWPTILPVWPKKPVEHVGDETEDDDGRIKEDKPIEDDHSGMEDEAGPSGTE